MQRVTVTFDRVFDITKGVSRGKWPCTFFSFQSGQASEYGVAVPGEPELLNGMANSGRSRNTTLLTAMFSNNINDAGVL